MVKAPMASLKQKESEWKQERQSLLEQLKLAFDRTLGGIKTYDESQGDLFNEVECEAAKEEVLRIVGCCQRPKSPLAGAILIATQPTKNS